MDCLDGVVLTITDDSLNDLGGISKKDVKKRERDLQAKDESKKKEKKPKATEEHDYWVVLRVTDKSGVLATFFPSETFSIDTTKDVAMQAHDQMMIFCDEHGETDYLTYNLVEDGHHIAEMFGKYRCIPISYTYDD